MNRVMLHAFMWRCFAACALVATLALLANSRAASAPADPPVVAEALRILPSLTTLDAYGPYVAGQYPSKYEALHRAYEAALFEGVPRGVLAYNVWMTTGNAVETPIRLVRWGRGGIAVWATICMPHDCANNQMTVLFAPGRQKAWGVAGLDGHVYFFGDPSTTQKALLLALLASVAASTSNELKLPVDPAAMKPARADIKESHGDFSRFFPR
jgi:hypothetical protein